MTNLHPMATGGFGQAAPVYARGRPGFPPESLDWLRQGLGLGPFHERRVIHAHTGSPEQVIVDRVASVSFIATLPPGPRNEVIGQLRALIRDTPALAGKTSISMPYVTQMYWCRKERR